MSDVASLIEHAPEAIMAHDASHRIERMERLPVTPRYVTRSGDVYVMPVDGTMRLEGRDDGSRRVCGPGDTLGVAFRTSTGMLLRHGNAAYVANEAVRMAVLSARPKATPASSADEVTVTGGTRFVADAPARTATPSTRLFGDIETIVLPVHDRILWAINLALHHSWDWAGFVGLLNDLGTAGLVSGLCDYQVSARRLAPA